MTSQRRKGVLIFALVINLILALLAIAFQEDLREKLGANYWLVAFTIVGCALLVVSGYVWDQTFVTRLKALGDKAEAVQSEADPLATKIETDPDQDEIINLARQIERMARSLQKVEASYRGIVEDQFDLLCRYRPGGALTFVNSAFCRFFGRKRPELLGQQFPALSIGTRVPWRSDPAVQTFEQEIHQNGKTTWLQWVVRDIFDADGKLSEYQAVGHDITDRKLAEAALLRANRAKGEFLAIVTHEIRNPISGVLGFAKMLDETKLAADQREYVELIRKSGDALLVLINDLLDFSKIEAGRIDLAAEPFDPRKCLDEVVEFFAPKARSANLSLDSVVAAEVPATVTGDVYRLRQVLINVVGNAIKFTKKGGVTIRLGAGPAEGAANALMLRFVVVDTGIGIAPEKMSELFKPFAQADATTARHFGGSGLGLIISKRLCELMGGRIWVDSNLARGSTFRFMIKVGKVAASAV